MKKMRAMRLFGFAIFMLSIECAEAVLVGVAQTYPDITLNQNYLIYDNNGVDSNTGLLKLVSYAATLNEGPGAGNSTLTQTYTGPGDSKPDLMISIAIDRLTGNWVNTPAINKVSINFGNSVIANGAGNTPGFSWQGQITDFGWQQNIDNNPPYEFGSFFDGTWKLTQDDYEDMPANMNQFTDGTLTNNNGGIKIFNSAGFGTTSYPTAFQRDWVFGANANTTGIQNVLATYLTGLSTITCSSNEQTDCKSFIHSTITTDVFATPIPAAFWLWAGALVSILPSVKRAKSINIFRSA